MRKVWGVWGFEKTWLQKILKSLENLGIGQEMIVKDPEKCGELEDVEKKWIQKILGRLENLKIGEEMTVKDTESPDNLKNWKEMMVTDTEKSGEFEVVSGNDCRKYWKVRRIWRFEKKFL